MDDRLPAGRHPGALQRLLITELPGGRRAGQWLVASAIGLHFTAPAFLLRVLLFALAAMLAAAAGAWVLSRFTDVEVAGLTLGMMPGGITELCLTAEALHISVALVTALQVARLLLVMFLAEPVFRLWQRRYAP